MFLFYRIKLDRGSISWPAHSSFPILSQFYANQTLGAAFHVYASLFSYLFILVCSEELSEYDGRSACG